MHKLPKTAKTLEDSTSTSIESQLQGWLIIFRAIGKVIGRRRVKNEGSESKQSERKQWEIYRRVRKSGQRIRNSCGSWASMTNRTPVSRNLKTHSAFKLLTMPGRLQSFRASADGVCAEAEGGLEGGGARRDSKVWFIWEEIAAGRGWVECRDRDRMWMRLGKKVQGTKCFLSSSRSQKTADHIFGPEPRHFFKRRGGIRMLYEFFSKFYEIVRNFLLQNFWYLWFMWNCLVKVF